MTDQAFYSTKAFSQLKYSGIGDEPGSFFFSVFF
jgi:hypothetical protein